MNEDNLVCNYDRHLSNTFLSIKKRKHLVKTATSIKKLIDYEYKLLKQNDMTSLFSYDGDYPIKEKMLLSYFWFKRLYGVKPKYYKELESAIKKMLLHLLLTNSK